MQNNLQFSTKAVTSQIPSTKILQFTAKAWFILATVGQWFFGIYIVLVYYSSTFTGHFEKWNKVLPKGYVAGDWKGNLSTAIHVILAAIIVIGGPLQIMPIVRNRFKRFHRTLGKVYVFTAIITSLTGFILIWTRGTVGSIDMHIFNSIQAFYIIAFAILTIYFAKEKKFESHQKWALRLYLVANGVWFFRVGLMAWLLIFQAPIGFNMDTFQGPFLSCLSFFTYAFPISVVLLEMYFFAQKKQNNLFNYITTTLIILFTIIMCIGIVGAIMGLWLPRI